MDKKRNTKKNVNEFSKTITEKEKIINKELFKKHFKFQSPIDMLKDGYKTKNPNKNKELVKLIKSRLIDLKNEIKKVSEDEKEIENPDETVNLVEKILDFNETYKKEQELKILTPDQMLN